MPDPGGWLPGGTELGVDPGPEVGGSDDGVLVEDGVVVDEVETGVEVVDVVDVVSSGRVTVGVDDG